jgi:hypothetical protein
MKSYGLLSARRSHVIGFGMVTGTQIISRADGFGSKVPGIGRPGTDRVSKWHAQFPKKAK